MKRGASRTPKEALTKDLKRALMRNENRHLLQRKLGTCQGKEVRVKIKGAHIRGGKGRGTLTN